MKSFLKTSFVWDRSRSGQLANCKCCENKDWLRHNLHGLRLRLWGGVEANYTRFKWMWFLKKNIREDRRYFPPFVDIPEGPLLYGITKVSALGKFSNQVCREVGRPPYSTRKIFELIPQKYNKFKNFDPLNHNRLFAWLGDWVRDVYRPVQQSSQCSSSQRKPTYHP